MKNSFAPIRALTVVMAGMLGHLVAAEPGTSFINTKADGLTWKPKTQLADMEGHYQVSWCRGKKVGTMFNRHPRRNVDERTDLFYLQTADFGATWTTVDGTPVALPITSETSPCSVFDYSSANMLVYLNTDQGATWKRVHQTTRNSPRNHGYVRRTLNAADRFATCWADGNKDGTRYWKLPYDMTTETASPVEGNP